MGSVKHLAMGYTGIIHWIVAKKSMKKKIRRRLAEQGTEGTRAKAKGGSASA